MSETFTNKSIALVGPMGAGKSTIGRALAHALNRHLVDIDTEIESRAGAEISWIFDKEGEQGFRDRESKVLLEYCQRKDQIIATGGGAVLRENNRHTLSESTIVVFLRTSVETQWLRTKHDTKRPLLQTQDAKGKLQELYQVRAPLYESCAHITVDTDKSEADEICRLIITKLKQLR